MAKKDNTTKVYLSEREAADLWGRSLNAFRHAYRTTGRAPEEAGKVGGRRYWTERQFRPLTPAEKETPLPALLGVQEVCEVLGIRPRTLLYWRGLGKIRKPDGILAGQAFWVSGPSLLSEWEQHNRAEIERLEKARGRVA